MDCCYGGVHVDFSIWGVVVGRVGIGGDVGDVGDGIGGDGGGEVLG